MEEMEESGGERRSQEEKEVQAQGEQNIKPFGQVLLYMYIEFLGLVTNLGFFFWQGHTMV